VLRASNGVVGIEESRVEVRSCRVECTGFQDGSALKFRHQSHATVEGCQIARNVVGLYVEHQSSVDCSYSNFSGSNASSLYFQAPCLPQYKGKSPRVRLTGNMIHVTASADSLGWYLGMQPYQVHQGYAENMMVQDTPETDMEWFESFLRKPMYETQELTDYRADVEAQGFELPQGPQFVICEICGWRHVGPQFQTLGERTRLQDSGLEDAVQGLVSRVAG